MKKHGYFVATSLYEGPLDLLLNLIERSELDITKLALAQVTDQYLDYIHQMTALAAEEVSSFLVIATRLIQIKSEALLPRPVIRAEGEEDPGEALARQLIEYRRFKQAATWLGTRQALGLGTYLRLAQPSKVEVQLDLSGYTMLNLFSAAKHVFSNPDNRPELKTVVAKIKVTIREKIGLIFKILRDRGKSTFRSMLGNARSRIEVVVTFLALLELIKRQRVQAAQITNFGEIQIEPASDWEEVEDFELEFGE